MKNSEDETITEKFNKLDVSVAVVVLIVWGGVEKHRTDDGTWMKPVRRSLLPGSDDRPPFAQSYIFICMQREHLELRT